MDTLHITLPKPHIHSFIANEKLPNRPVGQWLLSWASRICNVHNQRQSEYLFKRIPYSFIKSNIFMKMNTFFFYHDKDAKGQQQILRTPRAYHQRIRKKPHIYAITCPKKQWQELRFPFPTHSNEIYSQKTSYSKHTAPHTEPYSTSVWPIICRNFE